jgi:hypothetical protein
MVKLLGVLCISEQFVEKVKVGLTPKMKFLIIEDIQGEEVHTLKYGKPAGHIAPIGSWQKFYHTQSQMLHDNVNR